MRWLHHYVIAAGPQPGQRLSRATIIVVRTAGREDFSPCQSFSLGSRDEGPAANLDRSYLAACYGRIERRFAEREPLKELRNGVPNTIYSPSVHFPPFRRAQKREAIRPPDFTDLLSTLRRAWHICPFSR